MNEIAQWRDRLLPAPPLADAFVSECEDRGWGGAVRYEEYRMGAQIFSTVSVSDGGRSFPRHGEFDDLSDLARWDDEFGWESGKHAWFGLVCQRTESGEVSALIDYTAPPPAYAIQVRDPLCLTSELRDRAWTASEVPGWMKVELAAFGAWDLVEDRPTFVTENYWPVATGVVMTPESVGVKLPAGGEFAFGVQEFPEFSRWNLLPDDPELLGSYGRQFRESSRLGTDRGGWSMRKLFGGRGSAR